MNILDTLKQLRDDIKTWVANNLNDLNKRLTQSINNIPTFSGDYNDLTNAPDISEDGSGNMIIADESGNIIFKADADGIHTTAVSINGEAAATEKYVDDAVADIDVDLTGYATEDFVTSTVNSAKEELSESIVAETDEWKVVDDSGNIIFSVDADGAHTTSLTLNGQSVEDMIDDKVGKVEGKGLSTNDFTDEYKEKLDNINEGGGIVVEEDPTVPAWAKEANKPSYTADEVGALADTTVLADLADDATHRTVTDTEKSNWNAKSEFSGDYNDLENAPNITEDGTGDLIIADANGNIIFRSNGDGFETTQINTDVLKVNNTTLGEIIDNALLPLVQEDENKSIREIAREEALKIETAAMEFMGTVTAFPTGLTANDKGHMYKVAKEFTVSNNLSIPMHQEISASDTNPVEIAIPVEYYESIPESGKLYIDYQTLFDGNIQGNHKISVILDLDYFGEMSSTITVENGASYELGYGNVVTGARVVLEDQDSTGEENSTYGVTLNVKSVIFAQTVPVEMQGQTIKVGDTIIWDGYAWFVIPSGDDAGSVDIDDKLETLKAEILVELKAYIDEAILNGAW